MSPKKIYLDIIEGKKDNNIKFSDVCHLLDYLGFKCDIKGDHYIYRREDTPIINIQPIGSKAKRYQIKQIRDIIKKNNLEV